MLFFYHVSIKFQKVDDNYLTILFFGHLGNFQFFSYICLEPLAQSLSHLLQVFIQTSFLSEVFPSHLFYTAAFPPTLLCFILLQNTYLRLTYLHINLLILFIVCLPNSLSSKKAEIFVCFVH